MLFFDKMLKACLIMATAVVMASPLTASAIVRKGEPAPPIKVVSTSGENITLASYKGNVLVMDFFATWCAPCREAIPHLVDLNRKYNKQGLRVLGLSADEDGDKAVKSFVAQMKIPYPVALANEKLLNDYALRSIPTLYIINKKGAVVERYMGFNDDMAKSMEALIRKLLAE
jgi:thiol-disulfide isomerase/thioredoxin